MNPADFSYEHYQWAFSIVDSRSIWWSGKRHLVPLLDMINCAEGPDASRVHETNLDESGRNAVTSAKWSFGAGEEVFENYGQPNYIYLLYHGFVLDKNSHDCIHMRIELTLEQQRVAILLYRLIFVGAPRCAFQVESTSS